MVILDKPGHYEIDAVRSFVSPYIIEKAFYLIGGAAEDENLQTPVVAGAARLIWPCSQHSKLTAGHGAKPAEQTHFEEINR